ncbi:MAG: hypothetical protein M1834_003255 [Cirrosporium novae-zelandiae]|nr:MAG: hypothetical protein M1834_003255 [Cirrosporium novae-zelandiae]
MRFKLSLLVRTIVFFGLCYLVLQLSGSRSPDTSPSDEYIQPPITVNDQNFKLSTDTVEKSYETPKPIPVVISESTLKIIQSADDDSPVKYHRPANTLPLPAPYSEDDIGKGGSGWCQSHYGLKYLYDLKKSRRSYCKPSSSASSLDCFGVDISGERVDTLCIAGSVIFDPGLFTLDCDLNDWDGETQYFKGGPPLRIEEFPQYDAYGVGPGTMLSQYMKVGHDSGTKRLWRDLKCGKSPSARNYTIFMKREGGTNLWHTLMEIFSLFLSMDVLQMTAQLSDGEMQPMFQPSDIPNSRIILFDNNQERVAYQDLWHAFTGQPTINFSDMPTDELECLENVIMPLPGASNPLWQGDWVPIICTDSPLVKAFSQRILSHYQVLDHYNTSTVTLTFINRQGQRKFLDQDHHLKQLQSRYPRIKVQSIDFAALTFPEQLRVIRKTNILVGVHGAGLTHQMFLRNGSTVVEIQPPDMFHKGFSNLARLLNHRYVSAHSSETERSQEIMIDDGQEVDPNDWHFKDMKMEDDDFLRLMKRAIETV